MSREPIRLPEIQYPVLCLICLDYYCTRLALVKLCKVCDQGHCSYPEIIRLFEPVSPPSTAILTFPAFSSQLPTLEISVSLTLLYTILTVLLII